MENFVVTPSTYWVLGAITFLMVIYVANTIWFISVRNDCRRLAIESDDALLEFRKELRGFEEAILFDINVDATSYFKDNFKEYVDFTEYNPRYIFNLINFRNYIVGHPEENIDIFKYVEIFAISWSKKSEDVMRDYGIISKQYSRGLGC